MPLRGDRWSRQHIDYDAFWRISSPKNVQHSSQGVYSFVGEVDENGYGNITQIRTHEPMLLPGERGSAQFEIRIVNSGAQNSLTLGFCSNQYTEDDIMPGWKDDSGTAIAVDISEGRLYHDSDDGEPKFCKCVVGDVIKCILIPQLGSKSVLAEFQCNDQRIVQVSVELPQDGFYGVVAMASKGERFRLSPPEREEYEAIDSRFVVRSCYAAHEGEGLFVYVPPDQIPRTPESAQAPFHIGTVRSKVPIDPMNFQQRSLHVQLVDPGELCGIAIGVCSSDYPTDSMPGWGENSVAYHADIRSILYGEEDQDQERVSPLSTSDTLQVIVEPVDGNTKEVMIAFCRNGKQMAKHKMWNPRNGFHWCIGMTSEGEKVRVIPTYCNMVPIKRVHRMRFEDLWHLPTPDVDLMSKGICAYVGHGGQHHIGSIRSQKPLDPHDPNAFFEIKIVNRGHACHIAVGVCGPEYPYSQLPGWQSKSVGFHCDSGSVYHNSTHSQETDRMCRQGDVIRCSVEAVEGSSKQVSISFYHNGILVNSETEWVSQEGIYAAVSMMSRGEVIQLACPKMDPPFLKRGVEGLPQNLVKPVQQSTLPMRKLPLVYDQQHSYPAQHWEGYVPTPAVVPSVRPVFTAPPAKPPTLVEPEPQDKNMRLSPTPGEECTPQDSQPIDELDEGPEMSMIDSAVQWPGDISSISSLPPLTAIQSGGGEFVMEPEELLDTPVSPPQSISPALPRDKCINQICQLHTIPEVSKEDCRLFKILHYVRSSSHVVSDVALPLPLSATAQGLCLECISESEHGIALSRLPLSEKMPYYEAELLSAGSEDGTRVGLLWTTFPPKQAPLPGQARPLLEFPTPPSYGYVLLHTASGELMTCIGGEQQTMSLDLTCSVGDVIGCSASLSYKSEVFDPHKEKKKVNVGGKKLVTVTFFRNASPLVKIPVPLSLSGVFPIVCLPSRAKVLVKKGYQLSPLNYFDDHPVPEGYLNFPLSSSLPATSGWRCLYNCTVQVTTAGATVSLTLPSSATPSVKPSMLQHCFPFSPSDAYFEVELLCTAMNYSVLCLGASPWMEPGSELPLPGEFSNSVGCSPLLGMVMCGGAQAACIPELTVEQIREHKEGLWLGIGADFLSSPSSSKQGKKQQSVEIFFTINFQEVARLVTPAPDGGLFPTLAVLTEPKQKKTISHALSKTNSEDACIKTANVFFPKSWPSNSSRTLPCGIGRMSSQLGPSNPSYVFDSVDSSVKGFQSCSPLLPSNAYFEITVCSGGDTFEFSAGLAPLAYPLNIHPGAQAPSIAYMVNSGCIVHNGVSTAVSPVFNHPGVKVGCGAVFPADGNRGSVEVFFTVNDSVVARRLVRVPSSGFFPTIAMKTNRGFVCFDFSAPNPLDGSPFQLKWHKLENILAVQSSLQLISHAHIGIAQLARPTSSTSNQTNYFKIILSSISLVEKVFVGFSNTTDSPFSPKVPASTRSYFFEASSGMVIITQNGVRKSDECSVRGAKEFGCGIQPIPNSNSSLLFFTLDNQAVFSIELQLLGELLYPCICMVGCAIKVQVEPSALWPPLTPIGRGWGRYQCLQYTNGSLTQMSCRASNTGGKDGIGFAQASMPLTPSNTYFEVEVENRSPKKAIAIGLASRQYLMANWLGWKSGSIAYHADDGNLFKASGWNSAEYGPKYGKGDVVGCGVCFTSENHTTAMTGDSRVDVFFTLNGVMLGTQKMTIPPQGLFPTICLESPTEVVYVKLQCPFPPFLERMSNQWARAFCVQQAGRLLEHTSQVIENSKVFTCPKAFCQAKIPMTTNSYFEVEVVQCAETSLLSVGVAPLEDESSLALPSESVMFNFKGQVMTTGTGNKTTVVPTRQKCGAGDVLGCVLKYDYKTVEFYCNKILVINCPIPLSLTSHPLHPTIILTHPNDVVIPSLNVPRPVSRDRCFIGWLRSERVKMKNSVLEYHAPALKQYVGIAQISQSLSFISQPYYELEVLCLGEKSTIVIGAAAVDHPLNRQPGWVPKSIGYHGDDGRLFHVSGSGFSFGPPWQVHDVVGLGIRKYGHCTVGDEVQVYFTRNGIELGHTTMIVPDSGLFPTIGTHSKGERVKVHCGVQQQFGADHARLRWRSLVGVQYSYSLKDQKDIISFIINGRQPPSQVASITQYGIGIAIFYKPFSEQMQYFEVEILGMGEVRALAIGAVHKHYSLDSYPGWLGSSVAYHTDNGYLYHATGNGRPFGPVSTQGDKVGCGVSFLQSSPKHCFVFFTHNGVEIGRVRCALPDEGFYPAVALCSLNDQVSVTFKETFKSRSLPSDTVIIGLMRSHNCSYSDQILRYSGSPLGGPAKAQFNVALTSSRNFFVANIINHADVIFIGLASKDYPDSHLPGESSVSVAYNISTGTVKAVCGHKIQSQHALECQVGDSVGCGVRWSGDYKVPPSVFFTKNGMIINQVEIPTLEEDLFPIIGIVPNSRQSILRMDWSNHYFGAQNVL